MEIRVVSSLTLDDEARYATTFLKMLAAMLEHEPITYSIHIELANGAAFHQHGDGSKPAEREHSQTSPIPPLSGMSMFPHRPTS